MGDEIEEWKSISNYENLYEISNFGNVRSLDKNRAYKNTTRNIKGKILKSCNCLGYKILTLSKDNIKTNYRVHRIVAEHFINNPDNKPYVNHIDGNKSNNQYSNLEWVTAKENTEHSLYILKNKTNKGCTWENHNFSSIQCYEMINLYNKKYSFRKIAKLFKSNHKTISKIIKNEKYNN